MSIVDEDGIFRLARDGDLAILVPPAPVLDLLKYSHGSMLTSHYQNRRTIERLKEKFGGQGWIKGSCRLLTSCVPCPVSKNCKPGRQARLEVIHPQRRFLQVAFDVQTITPKTEGEKTKVLTIVDVCTRFVKAVLIPDEKSETIAQTMINELIFLFSPVERLLSDRRPA